MSLIICGVFLVDLVAQNLAALDVFNPDAMGVRQVMRMLDLGAEASFGTWYQVIALSMLSMILGTIAIVKRQVDDRYTRHWFFLALLALGFSLDEQVRFHDPQGGTEVYRERLGLSGPIFYGWVLAGTLSVVVVWLIYRRFLADLPRTTRHLYMLAAGLFVSGEIVMESLSGWYADISGSETDLIYQTLTSV
ncbi:MAG TPA: hypothetical protein VFV93_17985, partial [Thermomicrobiales bacterium]|nr:hypothetical protein [Thermomicrobiales bacterium]